MDCVDCSGGCQWHPFALAVPSKYTKPSSNFQEHMASNNTAEYAQIITTDVLLQLPRPCGPRYRTHHSCRPGATLRRYASLNGRPDLVHGSTNEVQSVSSAPDDATNGASYHQRHHHRFSRRKFTRLSHPRWRHLQDSSILCIHGVVEASPDPALR